MALTSKFGYQNTTASSSTITPVDLKITKNYDPVKNKDVSDTEVRLSNMTAPLDQEELLTYMCVDLKNVTTAAKVRYPAPVTTGVQYTIKLDEVLTTTSDTDAAYRVDEPVVAYLVIRHPKSGNITNNLIGEVVTRLCGACRHADGSWRFDELMRACLQPTED